MENKKPENELSFIDRLKLELTELTVKTNKLDLFIHNPNGLCKIEDDMQRWLLVRQFSSMAEYKAILEKRLELLEKEVESSKDFSEDDSESWQ